MPSANPSTSGSGAKAFSSSAISGTGSEQVDGGSYPEIGAAEIGMGGVYEHGPSADRFRRADWLVSAEL